MDLACNRHMSHAHFRDGYPPRGVRGSADAFVDEGEKRRDVERLLDALVRELVEKLRSRGVNFLSKQSRPAAEGPLAGKTVVITGTLPDVTREEAAQRLEAAGAKIAGSVSKKTGYVLAGEAAGSKLEKAKALGVPTVTWGEMLEILEGGS